jgi:hypothetical protein
MAQKIASAYDQAAAQLQELLSYRWNRSHLTT